MLPEDRSRLGWWAIGLALGLSLAYVVWTFIGTFVFGVFMYYATRPVYTRLKRRVRPRSLAALLSLLLVALPAILLLIYAVSIGLREFERFSDVYDVGALEAYVRPYFDVSALTLTPQELAQDGGIDAIQEVLSSATSYLGFLGNGALHVFVMIAIAFYLLRDDHHLSRWVTRRFSDDAGVLESYLDAVDQSYHQIFFGNILNAVAAGVIGVLAYNFLDLIAPAGTGIPYPSLLGLLAGIASLVPIVGMKLVYVPAAIYLFASVYLAESPELFWFPVAFATVSFVIVDTIPDLVLRPYVSGRNLHVGMVMLAYIFGPLLFGWYGIFLAPMILVLVVHFVRLVLPELLAGEPIQPISVDPSYLTDASPDGRPAPDSRTAVDGMGEPETGESGTATSDESLPDDT